MHPQIEQEVKFLREFFPSVESGRARVGRQLSEEKKCTPWLYAYTHAAERSSSILTMCYVNTCMFSTNGVKET